MANQPDHLRPWSIVDDEELAAYRRLHEVLGEAFANGMLSWNAGARVSTPEYNRIRENFSRSVEAISRRRR